MTLILACKMLKKKPGPLGTWLLKYRREASRFYMSPLLSIIHRFNSVICCGCRSGIVQFCALGLNCG
jgi:hypothetical protein